MHDAVSPQPADILVAAATTGLRETSPDRLADATWRASRLLRPPGSQHPEQLRGATKPSRMRTAHASGNFSLQTDRVQQAVAGRRDDVRTGEQLVKDQVLRRQLEAEQAGLVADRDRDPVRTRQRRRRGQIELRQHRREAGGEHAVRRLDDAGRHDARATVDEVDDEATEQGADGHVVDVPGDGLGAASRCPSIVRKTLNHSWFADSQSLGQEETHHGIAPSRSRRRRICS